MFYNCRVITTWAILVMMIIKDENMNEDAAS